jgi:alanine racemase
MGRVGVSPAEARDFARHCAEARGIRLRGLMSHFPRAGEEDPTYTREQAGRFAAVCDATRDLDIEVRHLANSAAVFDLPDLGLDAVRPGIALYGLPPTGDLASPRVGELAPVLEWKTRITFLKEVPAGTGLSYGHTFHTARPSLIATLPVGYGDGLHRALSGRHQVLIGGRRCPQVGTITMDQILVDATELRGRVAVGDEAVVIGRQGDEVVTADELAGLLGTIHYEVVTGIAQRVPRTLPDGRPADALGPR